jgi:hypothetical protein
MLLYDTLQKPQANIDLLNSLISSPATTATHFFTMEASGHVGDVTLVEVVFINFVNQG